MIKIDSKLLIFSYILQTDEKEIDIKKLFEYISIVKNRIKGTQYFIDKIDLNEISRILSMYSFIAHLSNSKIIINDVESAHYKISKFILKDIDEDITKYLVKGEKFIFPIIYKQNLILYKFNSRDNLLNSIKKEFCLDSRNNNGYIINLEVASKIIKDAEEYILNIIFSSKVEKDIINHDDLLDFINYIDGLVNKKYSSFESYFGIKSEIESLHATYKIMDEYHMSASKNTSILMDGKDNVKKLLSKK